MSVSARARLRLRLAASLLLAATGLSAAAGPSLASAQSGKGGPLELRRVVVSQHKLHASIVLSVREKMPQLRALTRFPDRIDSRRRHLCVAADGAAIRRRLLCVSGRVKRGQVRVGVSRYGKGGTARALHGFAARIKRISARAIRLRFELSQAGFGRGRFRYHALSAWHGPPCEAATPSGSAPPSGEEPPPAQALCRSRAPRSSARRGRIYKVIRSGCTTGREGAYTNGPRDHKRVALTFDDGPSPYTADILDSLDKAGAHGTFFQIGSQTGGYGGMMRKIIDQGSEIGNHSFAHEAYPSSSSMATTSDRIRATTGFRPCDFRPPYRAYNSSTVHAARANDLSVTLWDVDTSDYSNPGEGAIYSRAVQGGRGSIVLMHDGGGNRGQTAAAIPRIIRDYQRRGYELVTVTELLGGRFRLSEQRHRRSAARFPPALAPLHVPGDSYLAPGPAADG